jgi:hypothetical protein
VLVVTVEQHPQIVGHESHYSRMSIDLVYFTAFA